MTTRKEVVQVPNGNQNADEIVERTLSAFVEKQSINAGYRETDAVMKQHPAFTRAGL